MIHFWLSTLFSVCSRFINNSQLFLHSCAQQNIIEWEIQSSRITPILNKWELPLSRLLIPALLLQWVLHQLTEMFTVSNLVHLLQVNSHFWKLAKASKVLQLQVLSQRMPQDTLNNRLFIHSSLLTEVLRLQWSFSNKRLQQSSISASAVSHSTVSALTVNTRFHRLLYHAHITFILKWFSLFYHFSRECRKHITNQDLELGLLLVESAFLAAGSDVASFHFASTTFRYKIYDQFY